MNFRELTTTVLTIYILYFRLTDAQNLAAVLCRARLPFGRVGVAAWYDGDDTVYLFGGYSPSSGDINEALKYSITSDTIERAGTLSKPVAGGSIVPNKFGRIYFITGRGDDGVYEYNITRQTFAKVISNTPPSNFGFHAQIVPELDRAMIFGGRDSSVGLLSLDLTTLSFTKLNELPVEMGYVTSIWVENRQTAYTFSNNGIVGDGNTYKYFKSTNQFDRLARTVPITAEYPKSVFDGRFGYVVGGIKNVPHSIIQYDPETESFVSIRVDGYPGTGASQFGGTSAIYIEKLNRIYMFGGARSTPVYSYLDTIHYISLDPVNPPAKTT